MMRIERWTGDAGLPEFEPLTTANIIYVGICENQGAPSEIGEGDSVVPCGVASCPALWSIKGPFLNHASSSLQATHYSQGQLYVKQGDLKTVIHKAHSINPSAHLNNPTRAPILSHFPISYIGYRSKNPQNEINHRSRRSLKSRTRQRNNAISRPCTTCVLVASVLEGSKGNRSKGTLAVDRQKEEKRKPAGCIDPWFSPLHLFTARTVVPSSVFPARDILKKRAG
jgi:hypothetical protein